MFSAGRSTGFRSEAVLPSRFFARTGAAIRAEVLLSVRLIGEGICLHHQAVKALKQETVVHVGDSLFLEYQKFMKGHIGAFEVLESLLSAFRISWFMPRNVEIEIGDAGVDAGRECLLECLAEKLA